MSFVTSDLERYLLFSPNTESFTATNLSKLLKCESGWDSETIKASEIMENTHGWWLDIYAPTDDEMRALGKVSFHICINVKLVSFGSNFQIHLRCSTYIH